MARRCRTGPHPRPKTRRHRPGPHPRPKTRRHRPGPHQHPKTRRHRSEPHPLPHARAQPEQQPIRHAPERRSLGQHRAEPLSAPPRPRGREGRSVASPGRRPQLRCWPTSWTRIVGPASRERWRFGSRSTPADHGCQSSVQSRSRGPRPFPYWRGSPNCDRRPSGRQNRAGAIDERRYLPVHRQPIWTEVGTSEVLEARSRTESRAAETWSPASHSSSRCSIRKRPTEASDLPWMSCRSQNTTPTGKSWNLPRPQANAPKLQDTRRPPVAPIRHAPHQPRYGGEAAPLNRDSGL